MVLGFLQVVLLTIMMVQLVNHYCEKRRMNKLQDSTRRQNGVAALLPLYNDTELLVSMKGKRVHWTHCKTAQELLKEERAVTITPCLHCLGTQRKLDRLG